LGNTLEEASMGGFEAAFCDAIELGRATEMPVGLEVAAKAAFNLAGNLEPKDATEVWLEAIELGEASGTSDGLHVAERAQHFLEQISKEPD
ncbi:MAG: hypothetical protein ACFE7R_11865, partial [Candidatus Hodarchaeota archaeon]